MNSSWLPGQLASLAAFLCASYALKVREVFFFDAIVLASIFFISPVAVVFGSANSAAYMFDFFVPYLLWRGKDISQGIRDESLYIIFFIAASAGIVPLLTSIGYANSRIDFLMAFINAWRLVGGLIFALLLTYYIKINKINVQEIVFFVTLFGLYVTILVQIQAFQIIDFNIYEILRSEDLEDLKLNSGVADKKYIVLGFFKAAQGIVAVIFSCASLWLISNGINWRRYFGYFSFISNMVLLAQTGSKTSLVAMIFVIVYGAIFSGSGRVRLVCAGGLILSAVWISWVISDPSSQEYTNSTLYIILTSKGEDLTTVNDRLDTWGDTLNVFSNNVGFLIGVYFKSIPEFNPGYFHDEYLSVFALGGVAAIAMYFAAQIWIFILMRERIFKRIGLDRFKFDLSDMALMILISGNIHALSVAHFQPSMLFLVPVVLSISFYIMAIETGL